MPNLNKIMLIGHLGKDPETRYTHSGDMVVSFSLAVSDGYKETKTTTWFSVVAWKKLGETAKKYLTKGKAVYVEGRVKAKEWKDKQGNTRTTIEVTASNFVLIGDKEPVASSDAPPESEYSFDNEL
jgi:single-strand DNA-binding protein